MSSSICHGRQGSPSSNHAPTLESPGYSSNASNFPFLTFKYLRLSQDLEATAPVLQYLLIENEYLPEESSFAHPYRATQFLAFLCRLRGIHAVEYPSVRAGYKDDPDAVNMVILSPSVEAHNVERVSI